MRRIVPRFGVYTAGALTALALLFMPELAFAQAGGTNDALKNFSEIAATIVHVISAAAMLMMQFFPPLWGSELITGDQVTEMLRPMWIYIRNLTNIAFVGMILFLALSNLVTSGKGIKEWNIKSKLGPIILGLVAINFSMLAVRVLVDVVHVGTVALLSIADPVIEARGIDNTADYYSRKIDTETFEPCESGPNCKTVRELVNNTFCASEEACLFRIRQISEIEEQAMLMNNPERKNIMLAFGTFFMKLESLPLLSADTGGILDVLDSALFSLVFGVAYLLALLAMMVVLLVRVVMMWIFTIFSPLLITAWVMGFNLGTITDQFWSYLLVPVKAAAALAFGFVMISQLELMTIPTEFFVSVVEPGPSLRALWGPDEFGGWRMLWKILTVVLFWKVVFDFALADVKGMEGVVNGIKGFGEKAGSFALTSAADYVPIGIPGANNEPMTLASLMGAGNINNRMSAMTQSMRNTDGTQSPFSGWNAGGDQLNGAQKVNNVLEMDPANIRELGRELRRQDGTTTAAEFDAAFNANSLQMRQDLNRIAGVTSALTAQGVDPNAATAADYRRAIETANPGTFDGATGESRRETGDRNITVNGGAVNITGQSQTQVLDTLRPSLPSLTNPELDQILTDLQAIDAETWDEVTDGEALRALLESES